MTGAKPRLDVFVQGHPGSGTSTAAGMLLRYSEVTALLDSSPQPPTVLLKGFEQLAPERAESIILDTGVGAWSRVLDWIVSPSKDDIRAKRDLRIHIVIPSGDAFLPCVGAFGRENPARAPPGR